MYNFTVQFTYWWLMFLLIPAVAFTMISYFRLSKKYRKTRNRITSITLHIIVMILAISVLSGMVFKYQVSNDKNEIILLVDVSDTTKESQASRDEFVRTVLNSGRYDNYKMGIVTFGFDQKYAVPLTADVSGVYEKYINFKERPDITATNIAAALSYTETLFEYPETAKIVLITDGKETDEKASTVIRSIAARGTRVDTAYVASSYKGNDIQVTDVILPDNSIVVNKLHDVSVIVQSNRVAAATVEMYDYGSTETITASESVVISPGTQKITFKHAFNMLGLHKLEFKIAVADDLLEQNNQYVTYVYLNIFDKVLILESREGESTNLYNLLTAEDAYDVEVKNVYTSNDVPTSVDGLCAYDQIILNNISNKDLNADYYERNNNLPRNFDQILHDYVFYRGGGLLTTGGNDDSGENPNAYNRDDMFGTTYQKMLPVDIIKYTPPLGVVFVIDSSGSMVDDKSGISRLERARMATVEALKALTDRDYVGIMTLSTGYSTVLDMKPRTSESEIINAIESIVLPSEGTEFTGAIERAGELLRKCKEVDKRHIVIVTDGGVDFNERATYEAAITENFINDGITLSIVGVDVIPEGGVDLQTPISELENNITAYRAMLIAAKLGHGRLHVSEVASDLTSMIREELMLPEIKDMVYGRFNPIAFDMDSAILSGVQTGTGDDDKNNLTFGIDGFYGAKVKLAKYLILSGEHNVPIYAQWSFGKGTVGSFMCDLIGTNDSWSAEMMADPNGKTLVLNIVQNLMPIENIRPNPISSITLDESNYTNQLSVRSTLLDGQYIKGEIVETFSQHTALSLNAITNKQGNENCYVTTALDASNNFSRCSFIIKKSGIYKITLTLHASDGTLLAVPVEIYKSFSYSAEYNSFDERSEEDLQIALSELASKGNGIIVNLEEPKGIFTGFSTRINKSFDPKFLFIILAIVLFLLDIAVRKFKFKWPHEIYREYKYKKSEKTQK